MNFKLYFLKHNEYKEKGRENTCTCTYNITSSNSRIFECDARRLMAWISLRLFTCSKLKIQTYRKCPTFKQTLYMYKMNKGIHTEKMLAVWMLSHTYQSLACETTINNEFSKLFSLKRIYVKYKNAILSHIGCSFRTWKDLVHGHILS